MTGNFDLDLNFGQIYEEKVRDIFEGDGSIEVKTERDIWQKTGNIAIEIRYRGKPSGISSTDAKWWIHILSNDNDIETALMFKVEKLKKKIKQMVMLGMAKIVIGGDNDNSEIVLLPIDKITNIL
jgi:hypothetical protein|tara:strand:- start:2866 stop:3240 length:375 start_codon:yes stop_codon:yes gene_type:complete